MAGQPFLPRPRPANLGASLPCILAIGVSSAVTSSAHLSRRDPLFDRRCRHQGGRLRAVAGRIVSLGLRGADAAAGRAAGETRLRMANGAGWPGLRRDIDLFRAGESADHQCQHHLPAVDGPTLPAACWDPGCSGNRSGGATCRSLRRCLVDSSWCFSAPISPARRPRTRLAAISWRWAAVSATPC